MNIQIVQDTTVAVINDTIKTIVISSHETFIESLTQPGTIIAITAIIVSVVSLFISVWYNKISLRISMDHNKKSVEPLVDFMYEIDFTTKKENCDLLNNGVGPAILKSIKYYYNNESFNDILSLYKKHNVKNLEYILYDGRKMGYYDNQTIIPVNGKLLLFDLDYSKSEHFRELNEFHKKVIIEIEYQTIYYESRSYKGTISSII